MGDGPKARANWPALSFHPPPTHSWLINGSYPVEMPGDLRGVRGVEHREAFAVERGLPEHGAFGGVEAGDLAVLAEGDELVADDGRRGVGSAGMHLGQQLRLVGVLPDDPAVTNVWF